MWPFLLLMRVLFQYQTKSAFFYYLRTRSGFLVTDQQRIIDAYQEMETVFKDVRRESKAPYMTHLHSVATIILIYLKSHEADEVIAALLHDVIEDFGDTWTKEKISEKYGSTVAGYVETLTKLSHIYCLTKEGCDRIYHASFQEAVLPVIRIKLADRFHNNVTLFYRPLSKQLYKIVETIEYYQPMAEERGVLSAEIGMSILFARCVAVFKRTQKA